MIRMGTAINSHHQHKSHHIVFYDHGVSETMWGGNDLQYAEACANARQMAASPDMYAALRAILFGDHLTEDEARAMGIAALKKVDGNE
jgi:hypothetical protein